MKKKSSPKLEDAPKTLESSPVEAAQTEAVESADNKQNKVNKLEFMHSRLIPNWMMQNKVSIAFSTYNTNRLFMLGIGPKGQVTLNSQSYPRCMGLWASPDAQTIVMSNMLQILRLEAAQDVSLTKKGVDRIYVPRVGFTTGDSDIHDVSVGSDNRPIFVNTLYSCLATVSTKYSFIPIWKPSFISKLAPEDRCHLNGLAMVDGKPRYVTCVANSDVSDGWRDHRADGGLVIDITTNEVVASGLAMPHSPRFHNGKLWVHNSGKGEFGYVDLEKRKFVPITFCPGYLRGLSFVGDFAVVGMSLSRHNCNFANLPLEQELKKRNAEARCGIQIIDLNNGNVVHGIRMGGSVQELYDVVVLNGVKNPMAAGFGKNDLPFLLNPPPMNTLTEKSEQEKM